MAPQQREPSPALSRESQPSAACPLTAEEPALTWEDQLDAENVQPNTPEPTETDKKYQHKEGGNSKLCFTEPFIHLES